MLKGFKDFILRGNVVDLAVGVVIGVAFGAIVTALVDNIFTPLIGAIFNADDLKTALVVGIPTAAGGTAKLMFGAFIAAAINFLLVAAVIYFAVVVPINHVNKVAQKNKPAPEAAAPTQEDLLGEIRDLLARRPSA